MLKINFTRRVENFLKNLQSKQAKQIAKKIMELRCNPFPQDVKKLINTSYMRADVGEYRIIYFSDKEVLNVVLVGKRNDNEVYKELKRFL